MSKYNYNNKEIAKLRLIDKLKEIKKKNKHISGISILFSSSIIINRCSCHPVCSHLKNCKSSLNLIIPDISLCFQKQYILKYQIDSNNFTYYDKYDTCNDLRKLSPHNNQDHLPHLKDKIYYRNNNKINCNKYYKIFSTILSLIYQCDDYDDEKNKSFYFNFEDSLEFKKTTDNFLGHQLCCNLFYEELDIMIPTLEFTEAIIKF